MIKNSAGKIILLMSVLAIMLFAGSALGEYADVILNKRAEQEGARPVIFPHWFHRIRYQCKVCHTETGFKMRVASTDITMEEIVDGRYCGMCHNGEIAWTVENCDLCHSGKPGLKSGIVGDSETAGPGRW